MRENVERAQGRADAVEFSGADRAHRSRGLQEFVAGQREEHALGHAPEPVTGAAHPLQECRKRARRADVADQVDMSDVDAEFKRSGGDDDRHIARLELPLGGETDALVEAAVVCGDLVHAEFLPESVRDAFDQAPGVHEHDCRSVHGGEFDDPVVHGIAQFMARDRAEFEVGHGLDREIHRAAVAGVDDGAVRCSAGGDRVGSDQPTRDFVERLLGRGQPDPLERPPSGPGETRGGFVVEQGQGRVATATAVRGGPAGPARALGHQRFESFDREGQVRAALVAGHRVDLVHDQGARTRQHAAALVGGE